MFFSPTKSYNYCTTFLNLSSSIYMISIDLFYVVTVSYLQLNILLCPWITSNLLKNKDKP